MWRNLLGWIGSVSSALGLDPTLQLLGVNVHRGMGFYGPAVMQEQNVTSDDWLHNGIWAIAVSTNVTAFRYDLTARILYVAFASRAGRGTRIYRYDRVDRSTAEAMFLARSLGKFVHQRLKGQFPYQGPLSPSQV